MVATSIIKHPCGIAGILMRSRMELSNLVGVQVTGISVSFGEYIYLDPSPKNFGSRASENLDSDRVASNILNGRTLSIFLQKGA